ncbi:uncharacterized protein LOC125206073 isoform X2 [Salvia hispanica]|uniref:uncharacterized protein LOC125206073 isoform X2 n=1 Tax=Salvia hispanica TaxID=49212 RepID=UPI002009A8A2|nr:uncharacterized protein LOC125206073 isoform X2 [Salvia hispanica]
MEEGNGVDHFARITEELLSLILSRFENLKHLCGYSLVSKRFALAIYELKSVHLTLPSTTHSTESADEICELLPKLADVKLLAGFTSEEMSEFIKLSPIKELGFLSFLRNFRELRSISLDFTCPRSICSSSLWKVRVKFSSGGAMVELFLELPAFVPWEYTGDKKDLRDPLLEFVEYRVFRRRCFYCIYIAAEELAGFTSEEMSEFIKLSPIKELGFLSFLRNFRELRSISLDFTCPRSICSSSLWKVRVKFSSGGAMVELFLELPAFVPWEYTGDKKDLRDPLLEFVEYRVFRRRCFYCIYIAAEEHSSVGSWIRRFCSLLTERPLFEKMKQAKMEEGNGVDHFARITEELLSLILSRFENLKHLCGYSLVSKRFALAIYELKSVHLTLPSTTHSTESADEICALLPKLADVKLLTGFTSEEMSEFIKLSPIKELGFLSFLQNFRELRSISLDFTCPRSICSSSLWKVRVKFSSGGAMVELFLELPAFVPWEYTGDKKDLRDPLLEFVEYRVFRRRCFYCIYIAAEEKHSSVGSWIRRFCSLLTERPLFEKMKQAKMEEGNGVDHFARIPEELLSLILSRFENLKHLCGYSLVSKRFALAIYELKSVHLTLPSTTHSTESANEICGLIPKVVGFTSEEMSAFIKSSPIKELGFFSFLRNFRELRSISLDFTCPRSICSSSLLKVWVKFGSGGAMMELFLELPAVVHEEASSSDESSSSDDEDPCAALTDTGMHAQSLFRCCCVWLLVQCLLRKCHPSLASVTITNSEKEGGQFVNNINLLFRINKSNETELCSLNQTLVGCVTQKSRNQDNW